MTADRETLAQYRIERARETLAEAELMAEAGHWNACVNRLYYACFYAVNAILIRQGVTVSKHTAVRSALNRQLVARGLVTRELGRLYNDLFDSRQRGDYVDLLRFEEAQVQPWIGKTHEFLGRIEELLEQPRLSGSDQEQAGGSSSDQGR